MPTSHFSQLNDIVKLIVLTNPKTVLDVGVGFGKYGFLSREYLELCDGRQQYNDWKRRIDGIEVFKKYLTPIHDFIYDHIYIGNAVDILPTLETKYDLILLIDIIEHFDYKEGMKLLEECKKHGRNIIVSTPKGFIPQKQSFGNPFEAHKFQWRKKHFDRFGNRFFVPHSVSLICYIGDDAFRVKSKIKVSMILTTVLLFLEFPYRIVKELLKGSAYV